MLNSITSKVNLVFGCLLLLLLILAVLDVRAVFAVRNASQQVSRRISDLNFLHDLQFETESIHQIQLEFVHGHDLKALKARFRGLENGVNNGSAKLWRISGGGPEDVWSGQIAKLIPAYLGASRKLLAVAREPGLTAPEALLLDRQLDDLHGRLQVPLRNFIASANLDLDNARKEVRADAYVGLIWLPSIGGTATFLAILALLLRGRRFAGSLVSVADAIEEVADGDLYPRVPTGLRNELGRIAGAIEKMLHYLREVASLASSNDSQSDPLPNSTDMLKRPLMDRLHRDHQTEAASQAIIRSALDGIVLIGENHCVIDLNPAAEAMFSISPHEAEGLDVFSFFSAQDADKVRSLIESCANGSEPDQSYWGEFSIVRHESSAPVPVALALSRLGSPDDSGELVAFLRDLTESKRLEAELRLAQRLEAVGRLAAGIAHELNSPIQFIGDSARYLRSIYQKRSQLFSAYRALSQSIEAGIIPEVLQKVREAEKDADLEYAQEEIPRSIDRILVGVDRVTGIVHAMKEFAYPRKEDMQPSDINHALLSALTIAGNEIKYVAELVTDLGELPPVMCNVSDLEQVFLNILVNAAQAIREVVESSASKGTISLSTCCEGESVVITFTDTGNGIPESVKDRIFDPFFTTKDFGKGTGQGLAIARRVVVDGHHGTLGCEPRAGGGTIFRLTLPIAGPKGS